MLQALRTQVSLVVATLCALILSFAAASAEDLDAAVVIDRTPVGSYLRWRPSVGFGAEVGPRQESAIRAELRVPVGGGHLGLVGAWRWADGTPRELGIFHCSFYESPSGTLSGYGMGPRAALRLDRSVGEGSAFGAPVTIVGNLEAGVQRIESVDECITGAWLIEYLPPPPAARVGAGLTAWSVGRPWQVGVGLEVALREERVYRWVDEGVRELDDRDLVPVLLSTVTVRRGPRGDRTPVCGEDCEVGCRCVE